ncbi:MAG: GNAT family N-acetyltransferase [Acidimicrobiia bacterium]
MPVEVRAVTPAELEDLLLTDNRAFAQPPYPADQPRGWAEAELDRTRCAFEDGALVAASRAYSFELTLPGGGTVPVAAVSWVGVLPTHRRRGILTAMIDALHRDARDRGEPAAVLTASESTIYGRYGYGVATWRLAMTLERAHGAFAHPVDDTGRVRFLTKDEGEKIVPSVYETVRRGRAGMVTRPDTWWPHLFWNMGRDKAFFLVLHEDAEGKADGFAAYEVSSAPSVGIPNRRLTVVDIQTTNPTARAALWQYVVGVDLVATISANMLPIDEPLRHLLRDPRRARIDFVNDDMWLAPLDPSALLAARRYSVFDAHLVVEVTDFEGRGVSFAIDGNASDAQCEETEASPDLSCSTAVLGAVLLGGNRWTEYAQAGLVAEHVPGKLAYADAMFTISPPPTNTTGF